MRDKTFYRLLVAVLIAGILSVAVLVLVTVFLAKDCSILSYIANRRMP